MGPRTIRVLQVLLSVFGVLSFGLSIFAFYSYFFDKSAEKEGFVTISGKIDKYEKKTSDRTG